MKSEKARTWNNSSAGRNPAYRVQQAGSELPLLVHFMIAGCLIFMAAMARWSFEYYARISREDHIIEWATVVFYLAAAFTGLRYAILRKRFADGLVAIYCLLSGGEEFSWGQRLLGLSPPKFFMQTNVQQEINIHNLFSSNAHDLIFALVVTGYFVGWALLANRHRTRRIMDSIGATGPPAQFIPWAVFLVVLHTWHPIKISSEWFEAILAGLFLLSSILLARPRVTTRAILNGTAIVLLISLVLTVVSSAQEHRYTPRNIECARAELRSLLEDIIDGEAASSRLRQPDALGHRRVFQAEQQGYLYGDRLIRFQSTRCSGAPEEKVKLRHRFAVDPWGLSYWMQVAARADGSQQIFVYSFGPNRRRDSSEDLTNYSSPSDVDEDIVETGVLLSSETTKPDQPPPVFSIENDR